MMRKTSYVTSPEEVEQTSGDSEDTSSTVTERQSLSPEVERASKSQTKSYVQPQPSTSKCDVAPSTANGFKRQLSRKVQEISSKLKKTSIKKTSKPRWPEKRTPLLRKEFRTNDIVFATVDGHIPWPAVVTSVNNDRNTKISQRKVSVLFYGSNETADLTMKNLSHFVNERFKYIPKYRKVPGYLDAYKEVKKILVRSGYESESDEDDENDDTEMSLSSGDDLPSISDADDTSSGEEFGRTTKESKEKKSKSEIAFNRLTGKYKKSKKGPFVKGFITTDPCKFTEKYIELMNLLELNPALEEKMDKISGALEYEEHQMECKDPFTGKYYDFQVKIKKNDVGVMKEIYSKEHIDQFLAEQDRMNEVVNLISTKGVDECIREGLFTEEERTKVEEQGADEVFQAETVRLAEVRRVAMKNEVYFGMCIERLRKFLLYDEIKVDKAKDALIKLEALHVTHVMLKKNIEHIKVVVMLSGFKIAEDVPELIDFQKYVITMAERILRKWAKELKLNFDSKFLHNLELLIKQFDEKVYDMSVLDQIKLCDDVEITEAPDFMVNELYPELEDESDETTDSDETSNSDSDGDTVIKQYLLRLKAAAARGRGSPRGGRGGPRGRATPRGRGQGKK